MCGRVGATARLVAAVLVAASTAACDDYGDGTGPTPTIDIATSISALTVAQGASGTVNVTLTRSGGFAGDVTIAVTGTPTGVMATPVPAAIAPQSTSNTITIAVAATATPGTSTLTVRATGSGVTEKTLPVALTVTPAPAGANTTWEFCADAAPIWFAAQDGSGAWTRITPTGSRFVFELTSPRGGVAFVTSRPSLASAAVGSPSRVRHDVLAAALSIVRDKALGARSVADAAMSATNSAADEFALSIVYGTRTELNEQGRTLCTPQTGKTVNGSVAGIGARDIADVTLGDSYLAVGGGTPTFQLLDVPDGPLDLIASRTTRRATTGEPVVDRMIIRRALNAANNFTLPVLDFTGGDSFELAESNVAVGNLGTIDAFLINFYFTAGAGAFTGFDGPRPGAFRHRGVPAAKRLPGDLHLAAVFAVESRDTRLTGVYFKEPADRTITLGDVVPEPTIEAVSTTPYARLRAAGSLPPMYDRQVSAAFAQAGRRATIAASAGYRSNATTYDLGIPDFTGVAGWTNDWGTKRGVQTNWSLTAIGFTGAGISMPMPVEGATLHNASKSGSVTP